MFDRQRNKTRMGDITTNKHRSMYPYLQFSEGNPDAARCLFEVSVQSVFVLVPVEGEPVMSSYLGSCSLEERGVFLGRQVQSRQLLGLMSLILQVGLVRNGSGNDHIVVRDENAGSAGWPWDRTRAEHGGL
jgi:hypothetical protein